VRVVLFGPPGAGKGTQGGFIARDYGIVHLSTGELFRNAVKAGTALKGGVQEAMKEGALISDEVVIASVRARLSMPDCEPGFVLDGFPRTLAQAVALRDILEEKNQKLNAAIELRVDESEVYSRVSKRVKTEAASVNGVRDDDKLHVFRNRLVEYHNKTAPLLSEYYANTDELFVVDGNQELDAVRLDVEAVLRRVSEASH